MPYITVLQAAEKWDVSLRQVQRLIAAGRIPGVKKFGRAWMLPCDAKKPADLRREHPPPPGFFSFDLAHVFAATCAPLPAHDPDAVLAAVDETRLRLIYEAELAYLRGDFARTMACFHQTAKDDAARLRVCPAAIAAAISTGNYAAYTEIDAFLKDCVNAHPGGDVAAVADLSLATAAVSCIAPNMTPGWLSAGDLSALPPPARPNAVYLRAKYFNCTGRFEPMLATAQTALCLCESQGEFTPHDVYLRLMCAVACHGLEEDDEARRWLLEAMRMALPHGFITPFAEIVTALGGLMEQCLEREFPNCYDAVLKQWKRTWKNWIAFHNQFTKDHITLILSLREYHIAQLAAHRVPYAKIAKQYCISVGRLKNIMLEIYGKLLVSGRDELATYIL